MMIAPIAGIAAGQPPVNLGVTSSYAVLAGSGITNTGTTTINGDAGGDVGSHPTGTFVGQASAIISGAVHLADAQSLAAKNALIVAYDDAAGRIPVTTIPSELGGQTLIPGTYDSLDGTFQITGTLTLDAQGDPDGVFVFKTGTTLITAANSNIALLNSARYCRIFWQVGSSATLGTNSHFVGHIFALTSITANTGATIQGQLLARNGAVTLDTNTITNGICADTPPATTSVPAFGGGDHADAPVIYPPIIKVVKSATPLALYNGSGPVTYTYRVSNAGSVTLTDITLVDDKLSTLLYISGDADQDLKLQTHETWIYSGSALLTATTTNKATAKGSANGQESEDTDYVTVVVTPLEVVAPPVLVLPVEEVPLVVVTPVIVTETITGGQLPKTSSPWYNLLLTGVALTSIGAFGWKRK